MAANPNAFEANNRFNDLSSSSSLDYASYLFLDDSLFSKSYSVSAEDYKSSDFPGSELVNPGQVFASPGYNAHRLPFINNSKFSLGMGILSLIFCFFAVVNYATSFDDFAGFNLFIFFSTVCSGWGFIISLISLPKTHSRFFQGRKYIHAGIIFSGFSGAASIWLLILYFTY